MAIKAKAKPGPKSQIVGYTADRYPEWARDIADEFVEKEGFFLTEPQRRRMIQLVISVHEQAVRNAHGDK